MFLQHLDMEFKDEASFRVYIQSDPPHQPAFGKIIDLYGTAKKSLRV